MLVEDTIIDAVAVPDTQDRWLHRVSGGKLGATPMSECGLDLDDDSIQIQFVSKNLPTQKRKELPESGAVQLPAKRPHRQKKTVVPQLVVVPGSTQWFRACDARIMAASYECVSAAALKVHEGTVPLPFSPLDDSLEDVTEEDVKSQLQLYLACFSDPNSVMVLDKVESLVAGCSMLDTIMVNKHQKSRSRSYA